MIKVIASDMDGTLLGNDHRLAPETVEAIRAACDAGIRFMIVTGRNFPGAEAGLKGAELTCDYIVSSGAEVRTPDKKVISRIPVERQLCREIYGRISRYPVSVVLCTDGYDYRVGDQREAEQSIIREMLLFHENASEEELRRTPFFLHAVQNTRATPDLDMLERENIPVYKLFLFSDDREVLREVDKCLEDIEGIAVASSFDTNLEITDVRAQKGPVLKEYIESLGYTMDEVMAIGDSMNDYSMLSMDFGMTVAMANGAEEVKRVAKQVTSSNEELGAAKAIWELLRKSDLLS